MPISEFWQWFSANARMIADNPDDPSLIKELDDRIRDAWPALAWEIGPDVAGGWYLALSPSLDRTLVPEARRAAEGAPPVHEWRILAARPPKPWPGEFNLETAHGSVHVSTADWRFVFLRYPDGERELVLIGQAAADFSEDERWQAAAVVLEALLGEQVVLDNIESFALVPEIDAEHMAASKPLESLQHQFLKAH